MSSPQRPRTSGRRSAVTRLRVSRCSCACPPAQGLDLRAQAGEGLAALALECLHLGLGALERRAQRLDQLRDRDLALLERALRRPPGRARAPRAPAAGTARCCCAGSRAASESKAARRRASECSSRLDRSAGAASAAASRRTCAAVSSIAQRLDAPRGAQRAEHERRAAMPDERARRRRGGRRSACSPAEVREVVDGRRRAEARRGR